MKSERRHELQQNELADWMATTVNAVKPYSNAILALVLALLIAAVAVVFWAQKTQAETARSWEDFYSAMSSGNFTELDNVVDQYPGTDAAQWAAIIAGDLHLSRACDDLFTDKASANQELTKAIECYRGVLEQSQDSTLRERATFGLARARESQGKLEEAEQRYQELVKNWPDGPYAKIAQSRLDELKRPEVEAFYDRFAKYDPKPALPDEPGTPGQRLPFDADSLPQPGEPLFPPLDPLKLEEKAPANSAPKTAPEAAKPAAPATSKAAKPDAGKSAATAPKDAAPKDAAPKADTPKTDASKDEEQ